MPNKDTLHTITERHAAEELANISPEGRAVVRVISAAVEKLRTDLATNHQEAKESRQGLEKRLASIEEHMNPDRIAKRAEQDTQLAILWTSAKLLAGVIAATLIGGLLAMLGLHK